MLADVLDAAAPYLAAATAVTLVLGAVARSKAAPRSALPPGPKPLPLIGNALDIPREYAWRTYRDWCEQYGDVVYAEALGTKILILGSRAAIADLFEHRSGLYSDRAHLPMKIDLMRFDWLLSSMPYGARWRRGRKLMHAHVNPTVVDVYHPTQLSAARTFIATLLNTNPSPDALPAAVRAYFGAAIVKIVYGKDVKADDEFVRVPDEVLKRLNEAGLPGRFLVDLVPQLKFLPAWMPGAGFQRYAQDTRELHERMRETPMAYVRAQMSAGTASPSVAQKMLEQAGTQDTEEQDLIRDVTGIAYLAGSDTTIAALLSFFLAMLQFPDVQAAAQGEVDNVTRGARLPDFADRERMPYVTALVWECLRWLPVLPMGVPHAISNDDEYRGMHIPAGTIVLGSAWAVLHDPETYPEPDRFAPERYLRRRTDGSWEIDNSEDGQARDPRSVAFGFGRRICPGRHLAEAALFASLASALALLDIMPARDEYGMPLIPPVDVSSGLLSYPRPFAYALLPRDGAEKLLRETGHA